MAESEVSKGERGEKSDMRAWWRTDHVGACKFEDLPGMKWEATGGFWAKTWYYLIYTLKGLI